MMAMVMYHDTETQPSLSPFLDVALVEVVAVVLWDVPDGDARGPHRVGVGGGVVVLGHAPPGDLAVPLVQLVQRVVRLRNADRQDVEAAERGTAIVVFLRKSSCRAEKHNLFLLLSCANSS